MVDLSHCIGRSKMKGFDTPIVQAEFFHWSEANSVSFVEVYSEFMGRAIDGSPFKTTLRFYDDGETVLHHLLREAELGELKARLATPHPIKGIRGFWLNRRRRQVSKELRRLRERRVGLLAEQVKEAMRDKLTIMIMNPDDHSFRLLKPNERHEVLEAIRKSPAAWVFLYDYNDLAAEDPRLLYDMTI
jgi:hypothetical protein